MVHSSPDTNFVQEVVVLEKQKKEAKDKDSIKDVDQKLTLTTLKRDLAWSKQVRQRNLTLCMSKCEMLYAMKWALVLCSGVCGEQLLTPCLCKGCSVCSVHLH